MQVRELMNPSVVSVMPTDTVAAAAQLIARHNVGSVPVVGSDGGLRGILTDRDIIVRCIAAEEDPAKVQVKDIMTRNCSVVKPGDDARQAAERMAEAQVRRLPVMEDQKLVGMVALGDLAKCHVCDMEAGQALAQISDRDHHIWEN